MHEVAMKLGRHIIAGDNEEDLEILETVFFKKEIKRIFIVGLKENSRSLALTKVDSSLDELFVYLTDNQDLTDLTNKFQQTLTIANYNPKSRNYPNNKNFNKNYNKKNLNNRNTYDVGRNKHNNNNNSYSRQFVNKNYKNTNESQDSNYQGKNYRPKNSNYKNNNRNFHPNKNNTQMNHKTSINVITRD